MIKLILGFKRRQGMSMQDFRDYRHDIHAPLLFAIPEADLIRRFTVSYTVTGDDGNEPRFDAVVEAWFDNIEDMNRLYSSNNFRQTVDPDHVNFIDLDSVVRVTTKELVVVERAFLS